MRHAAAICATDDMLFYVHTTSHQQLFRCSIPWDSGTRIAFCRHPICSAPRRFAGTIAFDPYSARQFGIDGELI